MKDTTELLDAATDDIDSKRYERALAIAAVAQAVSLAAIARHFAQLVVSVDVIEGSMTERGIARAYQSGYEAGQKERETADDDEDPNS